MKHELPKLPYDLKALAPFVSEEQMDFHYNKHHAGYFPRLKVFMDEKQEADLSI
ncbi:MAG: superoxide dismutase [Fe], partial [Chlamydiae bacterium]|nr:superoxide dismutase [Fe] [Chlamydiota bacterium]